uniref:Homeodomain protein n=1 Tax=Pholiota microspora TaxID=1538424 RepID=B9A1R0_PHOMI|nr:homeodomain protein [Pholiota nameko]
MVSTAPPPDSSLRTSVLREFISTAQQLKDLLGASLEINACPPLLYTGHIPELILPFPNDILSLIDDMAISSHLRERLKSKLSDKVIESQRVCIESYRNTCRDSSGPLISSEYLTNLAKTFRYFYDNHLIQMFRAKILDAKTTLEVRQKRNSQDTKKPPFNSEYTPLLERYFQSNAYPSRPDRLLLATKSSMTERQIEVWFQNHRNRSKKEGILLKRISPHQLPSAESMGRNAIPEATSNEKTFSTQPDMHSTDPGCEITAEINHTFINPPQGASTFPAPYRPSESNSFANLLTHPDCRTKFPAPAWPRKTPAQLPPRLSIDIGEFINLFASKLSIRRGLGSKTTYGFSGTRPWFLSTVTIPSPAPHSALIRTTIPIYPSSPTPFSSAIHSISAAISHVPSISRPSTPSRSKRFSRPRKAAPFPFRSPQKPLRMRPAKTSSPAFERYSSRNISFTSVSSASSTQSRISSDSSRSSPEPSTPPQSPSNNPVEIHDPFVIEVHESAPSDSYDDIFAGIANPHFSDIQNLDDFLNNGAMYTDKYFQDSLNFPFSDPQYATA